MSPTRRTFVKKLAAGSAGMALGSVAMGMAAKNYRNIIGANDRINVAVMGTNSRGGQLANVFGNAENSHVAYICDVDTRVLEKTTQMIKDEYGYLPKTEKDIRKVLDDKTVDAIVIAAPDHWHAPASIMAMQAGKHVYVEKPCGHNPQEGEWLIKAQKRYGRVLQMGNQQRSSDEAKEIIKKIHSGIIGETYEAYTWYANSRGSIGRGNDVKVPEWLDWELWQGPAPRQSYRDNIVHYNWHWFWHWGTGESCNNATHEVDIARWALNVDYPDFVSARTARNFYQSDDWEMYDTMNATWRFPDGKNITWDGQSCNSMNKWGRGRGTLIYGTQGSVLMDRNGYELYDLQGKMVDKVTAESRSATTDLVGAGGLDDKHVHNFLETIRGNTHKQNSPIDEGHKSVLLCHLANIAYMSDSHLICDPENGRIKNHEEAMKMWGRQYEKGWEVKDLV